MYDYYRWHVMAGVCSFMGKIEEGKKACLKALESDKNREDNLKCLEFFHQQEKKLAEKKGGVTAEVKVPATMTKSQFIAEYIEKIRKENPKINIKQVNAKAILAWKNFKKINGDSKKVE
jgi:hypothetical protein